MHNVTCDMVSFCDEIHKIVLFVVSDRKQRAPCKKKNKERKKKKKLKYFLLYFNSENVFTDGMPDYHTFVSYFRVFQMSAIPRVFGLQL